MKKILSIAFLLAAVHSFAQTDIDGLMMDKNLFCVGVTAGKSSWKNYWEGTFKRDNLNLGTVSTSNISVNGFYGVTDKLGIIFMLPYIRTKATGGQLAGQAGIQDLSLFVKWVAYQKQFKKSIFKAIAIGGASVPLSNYTPDIMPLSIGNQSKTGTLRAMIDYQQGHWFGTASGSYVFRDNVKLDRNTYYTTRLHYSNEVYMPDASSFNIRAGYRSEVWIIEAIANKWITNGGFDITKNNMPFVSNKMNTTTVGFNVKYETTFVNGLSFILNGSTTVEGRNAGQATGFNAGVFYIMNFGKKQKEMPEQH